MTPAFIAHNPNELPTKATEVFNKDMDIYGLFPERFRVLDGNVSDENLPNKIFKSIAQAPQVHLLESLLNYPEANKTLLPYVHQLLTEVDENKSISDYEELVGRITVLSRRLIDGPQDTPNVIKQFSAAKETSKLNPTQKKHADLIMLLMLDYAYREYLNGKDKPFGQTIVEKDILIKSAAGIQSLINVFLRNSPELSQ